MTPIYQTSTYVQESPGKHKGYEYARSSNPTRTALQKALAALENGKHGICYASGLAATDAVLKLFKPGDEIIAPSDIYGGTYRLMKRIFEPLGLVFKFVDIEEVNEIDRLLSENTRLVWLETPTNPLLKIIDIEQITRICKERNVLTCVDNTFASPYLQNPLDLGADIVMHSVTKYLGGHSDTVMGALVTSDDELTSRLKFIQNASGAVPGPQDCFLVLRGIKTLHIRMQRHCENAGQVAVWLAAHPQVGKVYYPGLPDHPGHDLAAKQMRGFGGVVSFELKDDSYEKAVSTMERMEVFALGEIPRGRGIALYASCKHVARGHAARGAVENRPERHVDTPQRRHRGCRRSYSRPRPGDRHRLAISVAIDRQKPYFWNHF